MHAATESVAPFLRCKDAAFLGQACRELVSNPVLRARYSAPTREAQFNQDVRDVAAAAAVAHAERQRRIAEDPRWPGMADAEFMSDSRESLKVPSTCSFRSRPSERSHSTSSLFYWQCVTAVRKIIDVGFLSYPDVPGFASTKGFPSVQRFARQLWGR